MSGTEDGVLLPDTIWDTATWNRCAGYAGLRRGVRLSSDGGKQKLSTGTVMETVLSVAGLGTTLLLAAVLH